MPCVDLARGLPRPARRETRWGVMALVLLALGGCALRPQQAPDAAPEARPGGSVPERAGQAPSPASAQPVALPPPATPRNWQEARLQAARRIVMANPGQTYSTPTPEVLLAIPVLTIELHADGRIRNIEVMRYPSQARDTVERAKEAVRRAAPFGDVSKLPRPWKFNETFLFDDSRRFKPMTLDRR